MKRYFSLVVIFMAIFATLEAQNSKSSGRPDWIGNDAAMNKLRTNETYEFKEIEQTGPSLEKCQDDALNQLLYLVAGIESVDLGGIQKRTIDNEKGLRQDDSKDVYVYEKNDSIKRIHKKVYVRFADSYWEKIPNGYQYHALFMYSLGEQKPEFDSYSCTDKYGAKPVFMSIIPGAGQWYKGSKTKGTCLFSAAALSAASFIVCENQRASYEKKMGETSKVENMKFYSDKASNWETSRNISIGVAAGVWIYNIIDAAVAKGKPHSVVRPAKERHLSMSPFANPGTNTAGVSIAYNF